MTPSYRHPGLLGDERAAPFWPLLLASTLLHAVALLGVGTLGFTDVKKQLAAPVTMVALAGPGLEGSGGPPGGPKGTELPAEKAPLPPPPKAPTARPAAPEKAIREAPPPKVKAAAKEETPPLKVKAPPKHEPPAPRARPKPEPAPPPPPPKAAVKVPAKVPPPAPARPTPAPAPPRPPPREAESPEDHVAERIAKLREKRAATPEDAVADRIAKMREKRSESASDADVADRIAKIREKQIQGSETQIARRVEALREKYGTHEPGKGGGKAEGPTGNSPLAIQGSGTPGALGMMEANYLRSVKDHLDLHWSVPEPLKGKGYRAAVTVFVDRNGVITDWALQRSGNTLFDERVKRAVTEANPLPPVPPGLSGQRFEYELRFSAP